MSDEGMTEEIDPERAAILEARARRKAEKRAADEAHQEVLARLRLDALVELAIGREELAEIRGFLREEAEEEGIAAAEMDEILDSAWRERRYLAREHGEDEHSVLIRAALQALTEQGILVGEDVGDAEADGREEMVEAAREIEGELEQPLRGYVFFSREDAIALVDGSDVLRLRFASLDSAAQDEEIGEEIAAVLREHGVPFDADGAGVLVIPEVEWFPAPPQRAA